MKTELETKREKKQPGSNIWCFVAAGAAFRMTRVINESVHACGSSRIKIKKTTCLTKKKKKKGNSKAANPDWTLQSHSRNLSQYIFVLNTGLLSHTGGSLLLSG